MAASEYFVGNTEITGTIDNPQTLTYGALTDNAGGVDVIREQIENGIKETIIVRDSNAGNHFDYILSGDTLYTTIDGIIQSNDIIVKPPIAWDSLGVFHPVIYELFGDTIRYSYFQSDSAGITYPLYIDPTVILNNQSAQSIYYSGRNPTYTTARNYETANDGGSNLYLYFGQEYHSGSGNYYVVRSYLTFRTDTLNLGDIVSLESCTLRAVYYDVQPATHFLYVLIEGTYHGTYATSWFNKFVGWQSSGAYSIYPLSDTINSTGWAHLNEVNMVLSDSGRKYVENKIIAQDTIRFVVMSLRVAAGTQPSNREFTAFYGAASSTLYPKLLLTGVFSKPDYPAVIDIVTSSHNDSGFTIDSLHLASYPEHIERGSNYSLYIKTMGIWLDTTTASLFSRTEKKYSYNSWKNHTYIGGFNPFNFIIQARVDSLGIDTINDIMISRPGGEPSTGMNKGRWNPAIDKIQ